jgi:ribosomal protein L31
MLAIGRSCSSSGILNGRVRFRFTPSIREGDPATIERDTRMKQGIHPEYVETTVVCGCGNTFTTHSTKENGRINVEVCSQCHPFYTGKQKILDTGGRVARFEKRYGKRAAKKDAAAEK